MLANTPKRGRGSRLGSAAREPRAQVRVPSILSSRSVRRARPVIGGTAFTTMVIPKF